METSIVCPPSLRSVSQGSMDFAARLQDSLCNLPEFVSGTQRTQAARRRSGLFLSPARTESPDLHNPGMPSRGSINIKDSVVVLLFMRGVCNRLICVLGFDVTFMTFSLSQTCLENAIATISIQFWRVSARLSIKCHRNYTFYHC